MANREKGGRVVFIGNIPYGVSEEQICDIFGRCGTVVGFRLVYDKESGQPKGYGFLEFTDTDAAASAVRNLNNFDLNGRQLRVDYSNDNRSQTAGSNPNDGGRAPPPAHFHMNMSGQANGKPDPAALPPLPPGVDLPAGVTVFDAISQTLAAVPTPALLDFITSLKTLCQTQPAQATALLQKAPQLSYAVFQAMCLLNLVDPNIVSQLIQSQGLQPATQPPAPAPQPVPAQYQQPPQPPYGQYPPAQAYGAPYAPTPPAQQQAYQAPPQPVAPQAPPGQEDLIRQVLALTAEQIYAMDPASRDQIIALRAQFGAPVA